LHIYQRIYEFGASAGAFEGYVYRRSKTEIDTAALSNWAENLLDAYQHLPAEVIGEIQFACNQTLGRAIKSLIPAVGEEHAIIAKLKKIVKGELPENPDDFQKTKWFQE